MSKINLYLALMLVSIILVSNSQAQLPEFWKKSAYAIECRGTNIREVLTDFSGSFGVVVKVTDNVGGICDGWHRADNAVAFLNHISHSHQLQWYVFQNNLYVSTISESMTDRVKSNNDLKQALVGLGLYQKKFGWGDLSKNNMAIITGPRSYISLIKDITSKIKVDKPEKEVGNEDIYVFQLKYASVVDREMTVRGKSVYIPGVATILKGLLTGGNSKRHRLIKKPEEEVPSSKLIKSKSNSSLVIEADVRTNSVIIKSPEKKNRSYYEKIINRLDENQNLIEIDAVIVDINRDKLLEFGFNLKHKRNARFETSFDTSGSLGRSIASSTPTVMIKDFEKFYTSLKLLESRGDASIIANTSILTMENQPAVIDLSETFFIRNVGERVANVEPVTAGTLLNIIPQAIKTKDGRKIKLIIDIEDGNLIRVNDEELPSIKRTNISTKAIVDEERSLVIGGYHIQSNSRKGNYIPGLGKIPYVNKVFSSQYKKTTHQERIFILTPRISPTQHNPADYVYEDNQHLVSEAMKVIKNRWQKANESYVEKSIEVFRALINEYIPVGYHKGKPKNRRTPFSCKQKNIVYSFKNFPTVSGHGLTIYLGTLKNIGKEPSESFEQACFGKGLVAVFSENSREPLAPGESRMILVSMDESRTVRRHLAKEG